MMPMMRLPWSGAQLGALVRRFQTQSRAAGGDGIPSYFKELGRAGGAAGAAAAAAGDAVGGSFPGGQFGRPKLSRGRIIVGHVLRVLLPVSGVSLFWYAYTHPDEDPLLPRKLPPELQYAASDQTPNSDALHNWSGTHEATPRRYFQPESEAEVAAFLRVAAARGERLRPAGSGLSPNGAALSREGVLALGGMDRVISVDKAKMQVTVQAGCRVQALADALAPSGLTLQNYASIREQQIGGITQVGAHGTGPRIPPCDEQVVAMRLATPGLGSLDLSTEEEPELFRLARVGLGALGVMTQATLRCVPRHQLIERTFTATPAEVRRNHVRWLQTNQHIKYLYIPYTDTVVVVTANPPASPEQLAEAQEAAAAPTHGSEARTEALRRLYASVAPTTPAPEPAGTAPSFSGPEPGPSTSTSTPSTPTSTSSPGDGLTGTQLRDALLSSGPGPLDAKWVAAVNAAEADYWRRSSGVRVGYSDEILAFDCGGQQWVLEVAFPVAPSLDGLRPGARTRDLEFVDALLSEIAKARLPAPAPIEVRWTSGSSSPLSPAAGPPESLHCWVGVIMYLPHEPEAREAVTKAFREYASLVETKLMPRFNATWHWAKLEAGDASGRPAGEAERVVAPRLAARFGPGLAALRRYRAVLDPSGVLGNDWLDAVIGPAPQQGQPQRPAAAAAAAVPAGKAQA